MNRIHACLAVFLLACGPGTPDEGHADEVGDSETETGIPPDMLSDSDKSELDAISGELQQIAEAAVAWFEASEPPHGCPHHPGNPEGNSSDFTPSINISCHLGPEHRCIPVSGGGPAGYYPSEEWTENPIWAAIGFEKTGPHAFHYLFEAHNDLEGYGACTFTVQARADLDGDDILSTYTILGSIDANGAQVEPLEIFDPYE
ncbi:hypothetical protein ACNOYE_00695 [Nannocystaceae bacterium ST9]